MLTRHLAHLCPSHELYYLINNALNNEAITFVRETLNQELMISLL